MAGNVASTGWQLRRGPGPPARGRTSHAARLRMPELPALEHQAQRQTYAPLTSTRWQPAAAAPTAAPPTTARRVERRATPATLIGVPGRPTLACALSMESEGPSTGDHPGEANEPTANTAAANSACLMLIFLIVTSCVDRLEHSRPAPGCLI